MRCYDGLTLWNNILMIQVFEVNIELAIRESKKKYLKIRLTQQANEKPTVVKE